MKRKRLLFAIVSLFTIVSAQAKTDITSQYLTNANLSSLEGWTYGVDGFNYTDWKNDGDANVIEFYYQWGPNAGIEIGSTRKFQFYQTVTLPAGFYHLDVNGFYREGNGNGTNTKAFIFAGDIETETFISQKYMVGLGASGVASYSGSNDLYKAANAFSKGDFKNGFDFELTEETTLQLGFKGYIDTYCSWCILGPVTLYEYTAEDYMTDYTSLVAEAEPLLSSPMNAEVLAALQDAASKESSLVTVKDVQDAVDALEAAIKNANASIAVYSEIAAINAKAAALKGEDAAAAYADILAGYENGTLTEVAPAKEAYIAALKASDPVTDISELASTSWEGQNGTVAPDFMKQEQFVYSPERYENGAFTGDVMTQTITGLKPGTYTVTLYGTASYTSGRGFDGAVGQNHAYFFANDALQSLEVYDRTVVEDGTVETAILEAGVGEDGVLKFGIQNITIGANWFVLKLGSVVYTSTEQPAIDVKLEVSDAQYATFICPFDAELPEGVQAFTIDGKDSYNKLALTEVESLTANTPVLLYAENATEETLNGVSQAASLTYTTGLLTGTYGDLEITSGYVLQNLEEGVNFYKVEEAITVGANHAYIAGDAGVKALTIGDISTAINTLNALVSEKAVIYNVAGQRINKMQKGINIVNGHKILVK